MWMSIFPDSIVALEISKLWVRVWVVVFWQKGKLVPLNLHMRRPLFEFGLDLQPATAELRVLEGLCDSSRAKLSEV